MKTISTTSEYSRELLARMQEAADNLANRVYDRQRAQQSRQSMDHIREDIRAKHGVLDIGVPAIREVRDE